jgi:probable HAF family extracellular repeat protein
MGCHYFLIVKVIRCFNLIVPAVILMLLAIPVKAGFKLTNLGTLGGNTSSALAINNSGEIVGYSTSSNGVPHAFCYRDGLLRSLNSNPCIASAINDAGQIVGSSLTPATNIMIVPPPILPPFTNPVAVWPTNIIVLPFPPFTNITVLPFTNPIVIRPTNIIVFPLSNNLTLFADTATEEIAITVSGQTVGRGSPANGYMMTNVLYSPRPAMFRKGSLVNLFQGTNSGGAAGINDRGEIVGSVSINGGPGHAFVYRNGLTTDLGAYGGFGALGINNRGDVVGEISIPQNSATFPQIPFHPFLYRHGLMHDLGTLGGSSGGATAINDPGEIVGWSATTSNAETHAFLYSGGKMTDLGTLGGVPPYGYGYGYGAQPYSSALAVNNWGQIVGNSTTTNGVHAFLYSNGTMTDLNDLATLTYVNGPAGFLVLTSAHGINDRGQIVGEGLFWDGAQTTTRAFLMEWRPEHRSGAGWPVPENERIHVR